eukprot:6050408-Pyramimonas_sp.AAC.1
MDTPHSFRCPAGPTYGTSGRVSLAVPANECWTTPRTFRGPIWMELSQFRRAWPMRRGSCFALVAAAGLPTAACH